MLIFYGCESKISDTHYNKSNKYISDIDTLYCSEGIQKAVDDFSRGNLIANYTLQNQYGDERFEEVLFFEYNIIGVYNSKDVINKAYMDSITFLRFGNDIYNIARRKADSIDKVLLEELYSDNSYRYASIRPEFPGGNDSLKNYTTNYSADIDSSQSGIVTVGVVIDTTGSIKNLQLVYKHSKRLNKKL